MLSVCLVSISFLVSSQDKQLVLADFPDVALGVVDNLLCQVTSGLSGPVVSLVKT